MNDDFPPGPYRDATITITAADGRVVTFEIPTEIELILESSRESHEELAADLERLDLRLPRRHYRPAPFWMSAFTVQQTAKQAEEHTKAGGESIYTVSWRRPGQ